MPYLALADGQRMLTRKPRREEVPESVDERLVAEFLAR